MIPAAASADSPSTKRLVLRSRATTAKFYAFLITSVLLSPLAIPLNIVVFTSSGNGIILFQIFFGILLICFIGAFFSLGAMAIGMRTIVDERGIELRQAHRFVPWQQAHGRVMVKTTTQHTSKRSTTISLIVINLDHEQVEIPETLLRSDGPSGIARQNYRTAVRILSHDPWGQTEPLVETENALTPLVRRSFPLNP
ncbi:hypothetical protein [Actinomyces oris]|uniref:hypothetical protein n=1 Tax=Actinomyces oris TaxID=544580 RepID=UPI000A4A6B98|nr:hypothetical protein [Actinomyces oris]